MSFVFHSSPLYSPADLPAPPQKVKPAAGSSSNLRAARIPRNELLDLLFALFEDKPYWQIKALTENVQQPQVYLKEVMADIGQLIARGPYAGMWTLKDEYKSRGKEIKKLEEEDDDKPKDVKPKLEDGPGDSDDSDDDDMVEVTG